MCRYRIFEILLGFLLSLAPPVSSGVLLLYFIFIFFLVLTGKKIRCTLVYSNMWLKCNNCSINHDSSCLRNEVLVDQKYQTETKITVWNSSSYKGNTLWLWKLFTIVLTLSISFWSDSLLVFLGQAQYVLAKYPGLGQRLSE